MRRRAVVALVVICAGLCLAAAPTPYPGGATIGPGTPVSPVAPTANQLLQYNAAVGHVRWEPTSLAASVITSGQLPLGNGGTGGATAAVARSYNSGNGLNVESITSPGDVAYQILVTDREVATTTLSAARIWTLPAANGVNAGYIICVADNGNAITASHTISIARHGADTINGVTTSVVLSNAMESQCFQSDGTSNWTLPGWRQISCGTGLSGCHDYTADYAITINQGAALTWTGLQTFSEGKLAINNSANTFATTLDSLASAARSVSIQDAAGDIPVAGTVGTTTTVLHGNAAAGSAGSFAAVSLTADVTGTLPVLNGGTGLTAAYAEFYIDAALNAANLATTFAQHVVTNASTIADANLVVETAGVGAGNLVTKLCSDGATCGAGNIYVTCTLGCTTAAGTVTTCTVNKSAVTSGTTLTWSVATACGPNPGSDMNAHLTRP